RGTRVRTQTWSSPILGQGQLDPYSTDLEQKRLMLQRFQEEDRVTKRLMGKPKSIAFPLSQFLERPFVIDSSARPRETETLELIRETPRSLRTQALISPKLISWGAVLIQGLLWAASVLTENLLV
ncbi:hypothetical protein Gotri_016350, partial [Gossypium trilobum]|nr:hypothetical protein [Gossypium trilobum]